MSNNNHWRYQVYYYCNFLHPRYNDYVKTDNQEETGTYFRG